MRAIFQTDIGEFLSLLQIGVTCRSCAVKYRFPVVGVPLAGVDLHSETAIEFFAMLSGVLAVHFGLIVRKSPIVLF